MAKEQIAEPMFEEISSAEPMFEEISSAEPMFEETTSSEPIFEENISNEPMFEESPKQRDAVANLLQTLENASKERAKAAEEAKRRREEENRKCMEKARAKAEQEAKRRAEDKSTITASKTSLTFTADGGSETVNINASGVWELSAIPDNWAIVECRRNGIVVKVLENESEEERTDYLKIKCGNKKVRIDIRQEASEKKTYMLTITKVSKMMFAMATARSAFGWDAGTSRAKFSKLPLTFKIENKQQAFSLYNQLSHGGMEVNASSVTSSGETINCF